MKLRDNAQFISTLKWNKQTLAENQMGMISVKTGKEYVVEFCIISSVFGFEHLECSLEPKSVINMYI